MDKKYFCRSILDSSFNAFSMALSHKWDVKYGFTYVLTFVSLTSDGLGGVNVKNLKEDLAKF